MNTSNDYAPTPDIAEDNAYFPSPFALKNFTVPKSNFDSTDYTASYTGNKKVLMIAADERYLLTKNGKFFSTGNHPIETLLPIYHLDQAGFEVDVATLSGNPAKLEIWAMPREDEVILETFQKYASKIKTPLKLSDVIENALGADSPYIAIFIPGGHAPLINLTTSLDVKKILHWAVEKNKYIISLCHGPAVLLSAAVNEDPNNFLFKDYEIAMFPDALDQGATIEAGYLPGELPFLSAEKLKSLGVKIVNQDITGLCHQDRKLLTGDCPLASNQLGKMAVKALLAEVL
ncbi:glyoxalase III HchA [Acinetobacter ursingii]|uniref:glyoxalase III HchA n=1 Tax=Acinetobacter ursingii TaxID=108980 RepID=UPI00195B0E5A|nr:glyoxalase III HchA [Acinetobacter ursingii]MCH2016855.1 protein deglycase HchA [Acinetobacter ursingii]MCU4589953.1 protein deglycase HchA [Acinetobacter ursingii]VTX65633.1 Molecular chaperone Hsp31 and glyoxalase 3 [Acinetobacter ursingii]